MDSRQTVGIRTTLTEMIQLVRPEHANPLGTLYGGRMMDWIATVATLAAMRLAKGQVVLGTMDDLDFLHPVHVGDVVTLRAQVEYVGRSSMEVGVEVLAEDPRTGEKRRTTSSHLAMVAVDEDGRPRPVRVEVLPEGPEEQEVWEQARERKAMRVARLQDRAARAREVAGEEVEGGIVLSRIVFPEDAVLGTLMFAGRLMMDLDEIAMIVATRHCRGQVVTASVDTLSFYAPLHVGEFVVYKAALNHVGRTSMEIGIKALAEDPYTGELRHTCTAFFTAVHLDPSGRPAPVPPYEPRTPWEQRRWQTAEERRRARLARIARLREAGA